MSAGFLESWHADYWYYCLEAKYDFKGEIARKCVNGDLKWSEQPPIRQGLELWESLYKGGLFDPGVMQENYDPDSKVLLRDRKVAMFYSSGPWMGGYLKPEEVPMMRAAYFPKVKTEDPNTFTSNNDMGHVIWLLTPEQKSQAFIDLRVELIKFMDSPESQQMLFTLGIMPVYSKASDQPADTEDKRLLKDQIDLLMNAVDYGVDNNTYYPKMTDALDNGMISMAVGQKTIDNVLADLDAAQKEDLGTA
jgi:ABC-type glycerol-3-phosphate transport system substrate-binding protein